LQRITVSFLQPGMVVASNIYSSIGALLIRAGTELTSPNITKIQTLGVGSLYISNPLYENLDIPELVKEDTRVKLVKTLQATINKFHKTQALDVAALSLLTRSLVAEIIHNRDSMIHLLDMRTYEDYVFGHSVNVCILAVLTAVCMGYNETKLNDLALGVLLHDLGMTMLPSQILTNAKKLSQEEITVMQTHPEIAFDVIRKVRDLSTPASHIAFQHHERFDGKGYPRNLKGQQIHEYSRITAVADIFDALISDRPHRKGLLPHEAYEILMTLADTYVDRDILNIFLAHVAIYPIGTTVQLSSGEFAVVTKVLPKLQSRPIVRLLTDENGKLLKNTVDVDLTENLTLFVAKALHQNEIFELSKSLNLC